MDDYINAIIRVKVPKWQIGEEVSVYFPDTMTVRGKCEMIPPQGDLISRNALIQHAYTAVIDGIETDIIHLSDVDYAPTVTPLFNIQEELDEDICKEFLNKRCLSVIPQETLIMLQLACGKTRPKGKWVFSKEYQAWTCTHCGGYFGEIDNKNIFLYCPNCGADMGGTE